ncbi:putative target of rapamycin complex 2 subunit BIT2 [Wickerhamomyces ciferrii]|uniref:Target of rapamycin complex 2 subunit BIT2 n=1 Tax=Wickerhamomyces ciferrii (strain ATCC 14091 / BCRC 22168 / CBS 111 / JCM 3599 / NBRC 0793 / NRRL Y-1031 F-60-10) TaxID=1206466 RepID=K0KZV3_WICCF|nr:putative target of rapamycin complex 2 subunit BIT2 [Wickerhamomyces ciferrii]CCH46874.1 putative target of rapamycin complex 2 subunit BIT2 [Wickerhamomyces ciferrii]
MADEYPSNRRRSASTLANNIQFTHTRSGGDEERSTSKPTSPFGYMNKNGSSSTLHSITHTLSNVGFNSVNTSVTSPDQSSTNSITSPTSRKFDNALNRAKMFARNKTKELTKGRDPDRPHHFPHHSRLRINTHHGLSSSASNSKVGDSGSTLYSFDPSAIIDNDGMKHLTSETNLRNLSFEEKDQIADNLWSTITTTTIPLFRAEKSKSLKLKTPIEDLNKMVEVFLRLRIENKTTSMSLVSEVQEFFKNGLSIMENELTFNELTTEGSSFHRLAFTWDYFLTNVYHYLLAIFLPLQLEFEGIGTAVKNPKEYWNDFSELSMELTTSKLILSSFRDFVVIPYFDNELSIQDVQESEKKSLIQCFGILQSIKSSNYNQRIIEHLSSILQQNLGQLKNA